MKLSSIILLQHSLNIKPYLKLEGDPFYPNTKRQINSYCTEKLNLSAVTQYACAQQPCDDNL